MYSNVALDYGPENVEPLLRFNDFLDEHTCVSVLNENVIERLLDAADREARVQDEFYWLTIGRINELALFCAGNYADSCEFKLVGDFLINPRLIHVHVRGQNRPLVKERHTPLSEQFSDVAGSYWETVQWLKANTVVEIKTKPLLEDIREKLERSKYVSQHYLEDVNERKVRIASLTGLLACRTFSGGASFYERLRNASPEDRQFMESRLCRFDLNLFHELGRDIRHLAQGFPHSGVFLNNGFEAR